MPAISVIIPTYNYAHYLAEAIESVLAQTFTDYEIIVVDDGSTDDTRAILQPYIQARQLTYVFQENRGLAAARNTGIRHSSGRLMTFLDADDLFTAGKLRVLYDELQLHPSVGMVYGDHVLWSEGKLYKKSKFSSGPGPSGWILPQLFQRYALMSVPSVLVRRECFDRVGLFNESLTTTEDWEMWLRIAAEFEILYVDEVVAYVRLHPASMSRNFIKMGDNMLRIQKAIYVKYQDILLGTFTQGELDAMFSTAYFLLAKYQLLQGTPPTARKYFKIAVGLNRALFVKAALYYCASYAQPLIQFLYREKMKALQSLHISSKNINTA